MFAQDELSLGGFPVDIVEDLFDPVSCKMCRACFTAYTSMVKHVGKQRSKIQARFILFIMLWLISGG